MFHFLSKVWQMHAAQEIRNSFISFLSIGKGTFFAFGDKHVHWDHTAQN
jgi:hypothetical protein